MKNPKIEKVKCDILGNFQTLCLHFFTKTIHFLFTKLSQKVSMSKTHKYNSGKYASHTSWWVKVGGKIHIGKSWKIDDMSKFEN